ncbi:MAG: hypothetical protein Q3990_00845, partial [Desulfovibrionaceae bacterium]|nr:hypothetical protein [Desulfovibrionaceae bacterium]
MSDTLISCKSIACGLLLAGLALTSAAVPAYAEDWDNNSKVGSESEVLVGGTKDNRHEVILNNKKYNTIIFGHAKNTNPEYIHEECSDYYYPTSAQYNVGVLPAGCSGTVIIGGKVASLQGSANNNTIIMQSGSTLTADKDGQRYGGYLMQPTFNGGCMYGGYGTKYASNSADWLEVKNNTVIFKEGSSLKPEHYSHFAIHGGFSISKCALASYNKVLFEKGVNIPEEYAELDVVGGMAISTYESAKASGNYIGLNGGRFHWL